MTIGVTDLDRKRQKELNCQLIIAMHSKCQRQNAVLIKCESSGPFSNVVSAFECWT